MDDFRVNNDKSSISLNLTINMTAIDHDPNGHSYELLVPTEFFEEKLQAELTFYANGAMRIEVNDARKQRFQIANEEPKDLVINSKLEKLRDLEDKVQEHDSFLTVEFKDTNEQNHVFTISKALFSISLVIDSIPILTVNPQVGDFLHTALPGHPFYFEKAMPAQE